jgi:hypothetical protein
LQLGLLTHKTLHMQLEPAEQAMAQHHQQLFFMTHHLQHQQTLTTELATRSQAGVMARQYLQQARDIQQVA